MKKKPEHTREDLPAIAKEGRSPSWTRDLLRIIEGRSTRILDELIASSHVRMAKMTTRLDERMTAQMRKLDERRRASEARIEAQMREIDEKRRALDARVAKDRKGLESRLGINLSQYPFARPHDDLQLFREMDGLDIAGRLLRWLEGEEKEKETDTDKQARIDQALTEIKAAIQSEDTFMQLLGKHYIHLTKGRRFFEFSQDSEIRRLEEIYRENWKGFDPEWIEYLVGKFRESLKWRNEFAILRFDTKLKHASLLESKNIIGFLRYTPYDDGRWILTRSVYLWAVNIAEWYQWYSLLRYVFEESVEMQFISHDTMYLDTVPDSPAEKVWRALWFEPVIPGLPQEILYWKDWVKKQPLLRMKLTKENFQKLKKS